MRDSRLYQILQALNSWEINRLRKYLCSPYFNKNEKIVQLFELLVKDLKANGSSTGLTKERAWQKMEPGQAFDDVRFRKYVSDLIKLTEGFLAQESYEKNSVRKYLDLVDALRERKVEGHYQTSMRKTLQALEKEPTRSSDHYLQKYLIERSYYQLFDLEIKRAEKSNVEEISKNLDFFYIAEKLKYYISILTQQTFVTHQYEIYLIEEIQKFLQKGHLQEEEIPPIAVYHAILQLFLEPDEERHYYKLKNLLNQYGLLFPQYEAKDILYMSAQNYCIRKINSGNQQFLNELFLLYKDLLEKEIIIVEGEISPWYFRNIVTVGLRADKCDWTESFVKNYSSKLAIEYRENATSFNLAQVYFYKKEYEKVIELLQFVEYDDPSYNLNSKAMLVATYYETDEIDPLFSLLDTFRAYLNRNKSIPEAKKTSFKNFIKYTKKIANHDGNANSIKKIKDEIEKNNNIASQAWLLQKIAELEGKVAST